MSGRDERMAGRVPTWVWETLGEELSIQPDAKPVRRRLTDKEKRESAEHLAARYNEQHPDKPPRSPDNYVIGDWAKTYDPMFIDAIHSLKPAQLRERLPRWDGQAQRLPLEVLEEFWTEKADALDQLYAAGYFARRDIFEPPGLKVSELRTRAAEARRALALIQSTATAVPAAEGPPAWARLKEPSRDNDKWGPMVPLLDYALQTTTDDSQAGVLRRLAEICREDPDAAAYCARRGVDIAVEVPIPAGSLSRLKKEAFAYREHRQRKASNL